MEAEAPTALIPKVRDMLGAFLFRGDDVYKPLSVLSGGEKSRLALLRMLLKPMNLLILDEPTNHLDLYSKDILLETLKQFSGTIIFVSHDRAFMEALSTKTLELSQRAPGTPGALAGQIVSEAQSTSRLFYGNYAYYLDRLEREGTAGGDPTAGGKTGGAARSVTKSAGADAAAGSAAASADEPATGEASVTSGAAPSVLPKTILIKVGSTEPLGSAAGREAAKQRQTLIRRLERQEEEILKALETLEAEKARLETELALPGVYRNGEKAKAVKLTLDGVTAAIAGKTAEWEAKAAELEAARGTPGQG
jgi:ATP-binding cassette subfamily F protein 3